MSKIYELYCCKVVHHIIYSIYFVRSQRHFKVDYSLLSAIVVVWQINLCVSAALSFFGSITERITMID